MSKRTVVIVGGGFAGATLARHLERKLSDAWDIFLLSKTNLVTYNPLLPEVVGASVLPGHVVAPLRRILRRTRIRMVEVQEINLQENYVEYIKPIVDRIHFDHLVLAAGVDAHMHMIPGMQEHGLPLKTLGDALHLRNRVIRNLEEATLTYDVARSSQLTSFVVAGGGFSGVEAAGEIHDLLSEAAPLFKRVERENCLVHIVHGKDCLLPEVSESLGRYAERLMAERGVRVHLNARVASVDAQGVVLQSGDRINGATVVSTVGTRPHDFISCLPCTDERGRVPTQPSLQVQGYSHVWALGDCASVPNAATGKLSPTTAQFAVRQARALADNLVAFIDDRPTQPFSYRARGQLAAIGHRKAVAEVFGFKLSGLFAWLLWRAYYLTHIPTFARKVRLFLEWNWSMLFAKDITLLGLERSGGDKSR